MNDTVNQNSESSPIPTTVDLAQQVAACFIDDNSSMEQWGGARPSTGGRPATGRCDLPKTNLILAS